MGRSSYDRFSSYSLGVIARLFRLLFLYTLHTAVLVVFSTTAVLDLPLLLQQWTREAIVPVAVLVSVTRTILHRRS